MHSEAAAFGSRPDDVHALTGIRVGDILVGKYRIDGLLGVGGMGAVLAATHLQLEDRVALKVLLPEALEVPEAIALFDQEARAAAKIKHEHVVRVTDVGKLADDAPYLVMEYLEGTDLASLLVERGPQSPEIVVEYLVQACHALAAAHAQGIVHRDIKPSNLFLARRADGSEVIKVLDFGISKLMRPRHSSINVTQTSAMGTPCYMAPEQISAEHDLDGRADLWSLGVIAHELLVGRPPFEAEGVPLICSLVLSGPTPGVRAKRPDVPAALERVILRCLAKAREERYPDADALRAALTQALAPTHAKGRWQSRTVVASIAAGGGLLLAALAGATPPTNRAPQAAGKLAPSAQAPALAARPSELTTHDAVVALEALAVEPKAAPRAAARSSRAPAVEPEFSARPRAPVVTPRRRSPEQLLLDRK
jgi:eukaryotic-like serine/threonine-protein kinase